MATAGARGLALVAAALLAPVAGGAQVTLTLAGAPSVFPAPTAADYSAGLVLNPAGITFTVDAIGGSSTQRTTIVAVRASSPTLGGGKPVADVEWRRADLAVWNPMTTGDVTIQQRRIRRNIRNDPWSNTVFFRIRLGWTTDPPASYGTNLVFTLTVTTP